MDFFQHGMTQSLSSPDFSGAAKIFLTESDRAWLAQNASSYGLDTRLIEDAINADYVDLNLLINSVSFAEADLSQVDEYIGDSFHVSYFGRSPISLAVSGGVFDDYSQVYKHRLTRLYQQLFRVSRVARYGVVPNIEFVRCVVQGAFLNLNISENSSAQDRLDVSFNLLVFNMYMFNPDNTGTKRSHVIFNERIKLPSTMVG